MKSKIFKFYILFVLFLVSSFPAYYFFSPAFSDINRFKANNYQGNYLFYKTKDDVELFARYFPNDESTKLIVFLPDGPGKIDIAFESLIADSIKSQASLLFPDYRGVGKSERSKWTSFYDIENYVSDLALHIEKNQSKDVLIVSHGFGTIVAQKYEDLNPDIDLKQIMISPIVDYQASAKNGAGAIANRFEISDRPEQLPLFYEMRGYFVDEEDVGFFGASKILALMDYYKVNFVDTNFAEYISPDFIRSQNVYTREEIYAVSLPSITIGLTYSLYKSNMNTLFANTSSTTHVLFGEFDDMNSKDFFEKQSQAQMKIIPKVGFYPYIEAPSSVIDIIQEIF